MPEGIGPAPSVGHLPEGEAFDDVGVAIGIEVLARAAWKPRLAQSLEVLLGVARDSRLIERPAE